MKKKLLNYFLMQLKMANLSKKLLALMSEEKSSEKLENNFSDFFLPQFYSFFLQCSSR